MTDPAFAFVMAAFNAEATVAEAVTSLLAQQTREPFEIVAVDDGSTDRTLEVLRSIDDPRLRIVNLPTNAGRAAARNLGVGAANAPIVAIADADDVALPNRLETHARTFSENPGATVVGGQLIETTEHRVTAAPLRFPVASADIDAAFARGRMALAHPAAAFQVDWFDRVGGYDPELAWCEDYDLFARGWAPGRFAASPEPLIRYHRDSGRTPWDYWWQNERHLAAINARLQSAGRASALDESIAPYLARSSSGGARIRERMRRQLVLARDTVRGRA